MRRRRFLLLVVPAAGAAWIALNPPGQFGFCRFAWTTYDCMPHPLGDIQVRADGRTRTVDKTHALSFGDVEWLLEPRPDLLIIAIGWDGVVKPDEEIRAKAGCEVKFEKTAEAIRLYNSTKGARKIAIHLHSTC